jgi:hypothetical protein
VNQYTKETRDVFLNVSLPPKGKTENAFTLECARCGKLTVSLLNARLYDFWGVFPVRRCMAVSDGCLVTPLTFPVEIGAPTAGARANDAESYSDVKAGYDYAEIFQIREYAEGDLPKQIHWKLTQKYDRLIVKDPALPERKTLLVFWDKTAAPEGVSLEEADALAEAVVSVCAALSAKGDAYDVAWNDPRSGLCETRAVRSETELYEALPGLLGAGSGAGAASGLAAWLQTQDKPVYANVLYFSTHLPPELSLLAESANVRALVCGGKDRFPADAPLGVTPFSPLDYEQALAQIE